jgi:hypothetical protein
VTTADQTGRARSRARPDSDRRSRRARIILPLLILLNACVPASQSQVTRGQAPEVSLPPMKSFAGAAPGPAATSNTALARDFLELSFSLESGRPLPVFTRFEGPVTLRVTGTPPPTLEGDLARLLARLRAEAGIDIARSRNAAASITVNAVPRREINRLLPQAACFVAPNVASLAEFRAARSAPATDWTRLRQRERLAIFLPTDASPQEVRDCLHEELAQALGPLNDLYRLPESVFNDDNMHTVLTGFDMLVLRATYDPALRSGMTRGQVAAALPGILARINTAGQIASGPATGGDDRDWSEAIQDALGRQPDMAGRMAGADRALRLSTARGWRDSRRAFSHYAMGRVLTAEDPDMAEEHYRAADRLYAATPGAGLQRAFVAVQLGAFAVARGDGAEALRVIGTHADTARRHENAALLATLMLLQAEALALQGRDTEARAVRLDSMGWARYGFGPDWAVRARLREIAALTTRAS